MVDLPQTDLVEPSQGHTHCPGQDAEVAIHASEPAKPLKAGLAVLFGAGLVEISVDVSEGLVEGAKGDVNVWVIGLFCVS